MSGRITESFRQRKAGVERSSSGKKDLGKGSSTDLPTGVTPDAVTDSDISSEERVLRQFDLDTRYGPCTGMTRLERWQRAEKFGLNPPQQVRSLIQQLQGEQWDKNIWDGRV